MDPTPLLVQIETLPNIFLFNLIFDQTLSITSGDQQMQNEGVIFSVQDHLAFISIFMFLED